MLKILLLVLSLYNETYYTKELLNLTSKINIFIQDILEHLVKPLQKNGTVKSNGHGSEEVENLSFYYILCFFIS